ncbi:hypothetical protein MCOR27_005282 [Pyricularia oryzae]|uniref:Serine hydrolase domain-containing protein n=2 Tax=Pyricularia TaxID=48558 RepID=A0ABQ8NTX7_PYRGI|nr:hypothetical protein MCOR01_009566 [Pyricularia oryzae]KAI6302093.1 hypothetical protein MCOR33_002552 [Pyricularia grisea]KAH9437163.1 hypothetical protein MCOR02_000817 [Pyricularia oryzae]KAI6260504.1 hypothetical protein MCOR19_003189 [Pyricularia oryzae]KAI6279144.1 hypothetical protein MCOR27_005282 [Pyricularia oryzae]
MIRSCLLAKPNICFGSRLPVSHFYILRHKSTTMSANEHHTEQANRPQAAPQSRPQAAKKPAKKEIKILMLHGYTQSGPLFHAKTRALEKLMIKSLAPFNLQPTLIYPTAPNQLRSVDIPGCDPVAGQDDPRATDSWSWFRMFDATGAYRLLREGMSRLTEAVRDAGGVDGVIGFSQGAVMASMMTGVLDEPRREVPGSDSAKQWVAELREANGGRALKFAVFYSGFAAKPPGLGWMYEPSINTPTMHFIGSLDTVVDEKRSRHLAEKCVNSIVIEHPGGHHVPTGKEHAMPLIGFIKQKCVDDAAAADAAAA